MAVILRGLTWDDPRGHAPLAAVGDAFAAAHGATVEWRVVSAHDYQTKAWAELCRDVDLALIDYGRIAEAVVGETLVPLAPPAADYVAGAETLFAWGDQSWAVPVDVTCHASLVDASVAWDLPQNFDRVAYISSPLILGMPLADAQPYRLLASLLAGEGQPITDAGFPRFAAMDVALYRLYYLKRLCHPNSSHWHVDEFLATMDKRVVNYAPLLDVTAEMARHRQITPCPLPQSTTVSAFGLAAIAGGREPELAAAFAAYAGSAEVQAGAWLAAGGQPAHRQGWDVLAAELPQIAALREIAENAVSTPRFPSARKMELAISRALMDWMSSEDFMLIREARDLDPELRRTMAAAMAASA